MGYSNQKDCKIIRKCARCGKKMSFANTGRFRVNANKNRLDVWLIYQCEKCRHTLNIPIYERVAAGSIPAELYEKFLGNDPDLAARYGGDAAFLRARRFAAVK